MLDPRPIGSRFLIESTAGSRPAASRTAANTRIRTFSAWIPIQTRPMTTRTPIVAATARRTQSPGSSPTSASVVWSSVSGSGAAAAARSFMRIEPGWRQGHRASGAAESCRADACASANRSGSSWPYSSSLRASETIHTTTRVSTDTIIALVTDRRQRSDGADGDRTEDTPSVVPEREHARL